MYQEILPVVSLLAAMQNLFTRLVGENTFGLQDLVSPSPRRFRKFLSILANFYFFTDIEYGKVEDIRTDVSKMVQAKKGRTERKICKVCCNVLLLNFNCTSSFL